MSQRLWGFINPPGDAHDFGKERSVLCAAKIGAGNVIHNKNYYDVSYIMSCPTNGHETRIAPHFVLSRLRSAAVGAGQASLAPSALNTFEIAHFSPKNGSFSCFCGSSRHAFSYKYETHVYLTLVSYNLTSIL